MSNLNERRGTFVGTAYYVSPEMLKQNESGPASDIWALGCIIYRMLSGDVPFSGSTDYQTFQIILERKLTFPDSTPFSQEAKDLIDRLLQLEPYHRLGAGRPGSDNDYTALKAHPFFRGLDFSSLNQLTVPLDIKQPEFELPKPQLPSSVSTHKTQTSDDPIAH